MCMTGSGICQEAKLEQGFRISVVKPVGLVRRWRSVEDPSGDLGTSLLSIRITMIGGNWSRRAKEL